MKLYKEGQKFILIDTLHLPIIRKQLNSSKIDDCYFVLETNFANKNFHSEYCMQLKVYSSNSTRKSRNEGIEIYVTKGELKALEQRSLECR